MSDPIRLVSKRDKVAQNAIEHMRELLARAEAGEIIAIFGVAELSNGNYENFGSSTMSRLQMTGALFEAAIERMGKS